MQVINDIKCSGVNLIRMNQKYQYRNTSKNQKYDDLEDVSRNIIHTSINIYQLFEKLEHFVALVGITVVSFYLNFKWHTFA